MKSLHGKVIIVAGGTGGIGNATSRLLASQGATIIVANRANERMKPLLRELRESSPESTSVTIDLRSLAAWQNIVEFAERKFQSIDVLVNCVGMTIPGTLDRISESEIQHVIHTNILSAINGAKAVLPMMQRQGNGHIINVGSLGGIIPMPFGALYSTTKFAVRGLSLSLDEELKNSGIKVSLISPGPVRTRMLDVEATDDLSTITFFNKPLEPLEVAHAVLRLIRRPKREIFLPRWTTRIAFLLNLFPRLFSICYPFFSFVGSYRQKKYRQQSSTYPNLSDVER